MKKLTSSLFTFEDIIHDDFLYIDKTEYIWNLVSQGKGQYFLARPRRFGKSLTLSTLKAVFEGKKELFQGLAIYDKPYDWKSYPVIHLDFNGLEFNTPDDLEISLCTLLTEQADGQGYILKSQTAILKFRELIRLCAKQQRVVILIDEYDKPILNHIDEPDAQDILNKLKPFYSVIKALQHNIHFSFVTGVSKFSHVSMFSDLNNLTDLSMMPDYATMLGYTQHELETGFAEHIANAASQREENRAHLLEELKRWYNGYRFEKTAATVYNPVSIANFFLGGAELNNYWFTTGTPTFLLKLIHQKDLDLEEALNSTIPAEAFGVFDIKALNPLPLLFQTGYLTITNIEKKNDRTLYTLDFPNLEVRFSFSEYLLEAYAGDNSHKAINFCKLLLKAMDTCNMELLHTTLKSFFASVPYDLHHQHEANFHNIFFAIFKLLGFHITAEARTSDGRIDAVCQTDAWLYLFEFKLNSNQTGLEQIYKKEYFAPYLLSDRRIMLVEANFDTKSGKLCHWQYQEFVCTSAEETSKC